MNNGHLWLVCYLIANPGHWLETHSWGAFPISFAWASALYCAFQIVRKLDD